MSESSSPGRSAVDLDTRRINESIFRVWLGQPNRDQPSKWLGTAFAIGPHHCLTAAHVVENHAPKRLFIQGMGLLSECRVKSTELNPQRDVALLEFDKGNPPFKNTLPFSQSGLSQGGQLWTCGYVDPSQSVQPTPVSVAQFDGNVSAYGLSGQMAKGKSGACVLNAGFQVVGVAYCDDQSKHNHYGISVESIRDWLNAFDIPVSAAAAPSLTREQQTLLQQLRKKITPEESLLKQVQGQAATSTTAYHLQRYALRGQSPVLDNLFVNLILLIDHGKNHERGQFQEHTRFADLLTLLNERPNDTALVLLGRPGNGKTTLLRDLEKRLCLQAVLNSEEKAPLPFYLELNQYPPKNQPDMEPGNWVEGQWQKKYPDLQPLSAIMDEQPVLLLLDALNEMRIQRDEHADKIRDWRMYLHDLREQFPHARVLFTCRSLDYSSQLSDVDELPVPQIEFAELTPEVIDEFLQNYLPDSWEELRDMLADIPGLELKTPFYLRLAVDYFKATGKVPPGSSALIAAMIWQSLKRERGKFSSLLDEFLTESDKKLIDDSSAWIRTPHKLPGRGLPITGLVQLAWSMQQSEGAGRQISREYTDIIEDLAPACNQDTDQAVRLLELAGQLDALERVDTDASWKFSHQLLQEYLAAHQLAGEDHLAMLHKPWCRDELLPDLRASMTSIGVADPLPGRAASGWEETAVHAAAISDDPRQFIERVCAQDRVLAARCALHSEVSSRLEGQDQEGAFKYQLQQQLLAMSQDQETDLRARIEAGLALGELGDPRYPRQAGAEADFIPPPLARVSAGDYSIGSDEGESDEEPVHSVRLSEFQIGQFPVTNAEWQCFMDADGYEDPRWWRTPDAKRWQRGEREQTDTIDWLIDLYKELEKDFEGTCNRRNVSELQRHEWRGWLQDWPDEAQFTATVKNQFKPQRFRQPTEWDNPRFNNPCQPLVGICWFEAVAYCHWLSHQSGLGFTLPSEAQWKAVAQRRAGGRYPWGNDEEGFEALLPRANTDELHLRQTTPVGMWVTGAAVWADQPIYDLAGNVGEWSRSLYRPYPIQAGDERDDPTLSGTRVINGGAWNLPPIYACAAYRYGSHPDYRYLTLGFRVVCSPPSVSTGH